MSSTDGADNGKLGEREMAQLDDLANADGDASVADHTVGSAELEAAKTADEVETAASRELAARFLAAVDRPLWRFDPARLSVGPETTTFIGLIGAREVGLARKKDHGESGT